MDISHTKEEESTTDIPASNISNIALYSLSRAHSFLAGLSHKPHWTNADTSPFDCLHYDGDTALEHCASKLDLQADQHVLDIGSGFGATGRFLASNYGVYVTGIELQRENHDLAQLITSKNEDPRVVERVRSVNADFLHLTPDILAVAGGDGEPSSAQYDHVISLLCIMHIPESARSALFRQAAQFLKPGGKLYVEDFYDRSCQSDTVSRLTEGELRQLQEVVACSYLPSKKEYVGDVAIAGFEDVEFEDVSGKWTPWVSARAEKYRVSGSPNAGLQGFYHTVAGFFEGGKVGGVRLTAVRR